MPVYIIDALQYYGERCWCKVLTPEQQLSQNISAPNYPYYGSILQTNHICASQHVRQNCFSEGRIDIAMFFDHSRSFVQTSQTTCYSTAGSMTTGQASTTSTSNSGWFSSFTTNSFNQSSSSSSSSASSSGFFFSSSHAANSGGANLRDCNVWMPQSMWRILLPGMKIYLLL